MVSTMPTVILSQLMIDFIVPINGEQRESKNQESGRQNEEKACQTCGSPHASRTSAGARNHKEIWSGTPGRRGLSDSLVCQRTMGRFRRVVRRSSGEGSQAYRRYTHEDESGYA